MIQLVSNNLNYVRLIPLTGINFIDTPTDWCYCFSASEDTYHFYFHVEILLRLNLLSSVSDMLPVNQQFPSLDEIVSIRSFLTKLP